MFSALQPRITNSYPNQFGPNRLKNSAIIHSHWLSLHPEQASKVVPQKNEGKSWEGVFAWFWQGFFRGDLVPQKNEGMDGEMERRVFLRDAMHHKYWPQPPPETSSILPNQVVDGNCNENLDLKQIRLIDKVLSITRDITNHPKVVDLGLKAYDSEFNLISPYETLDSIWKM